MTNRTPRLWLNVWNNFVNSIKPRKIDGNFMGEDHFGNKYYEIPPNPSIGKRKPSRWFTPTTGEDGFNKEKPAEWESWLRFRRSEPPSTDEIEKNLAIIHMKQKNAAILDKKAAEERIRDGRQLPQPDKSGAGSFPKYEDYHHGKPKTED